MPKKTTTKQRHSAMDKKAKRKRTFAFHLDWVEVMKSCPKDVRCEVYDAIMEYALTGDVPQMGPEAQIAFAFVKKDMENDQARSAARCEKNRENGLKGGAPKGNCNAKKKAASDTEDKPPEPKPTKPKRKPKAKAVTPKKEDAPAVVEQPILPIVEQSTPPPQPPTPTTPTPTDPDPPAETPPPLTPEQQAKADKKKKYKYAECVTLTRDEYAKLCENYGEEAAKWMINKLDNYKGAKGTRYKSDYRAILNWVVDRYNEETSKHGIYQQPRPQTATNGNGGSQSPTGPTRGTAPADTTAGGQYDEYAQKDYSERF